MPSCLMTRLRIIWRTASSPAAVVQNCCRQQRLLPRGVVGDAVQVQNYQIGGTTLGDAAPVTEAKPTGGKTTHLVHGLLYGQQFGLSNKLAEHSREASVSTGMRVGDVVYAI